MSMWFIVINSDTNLSKSTMYNSKSKHIDMRHHQLKDTVKEKTTQLKKIHIDENVLYMLAKMFPKQKLQLCIGWWDWTPRDQVGIPPSHVGGKDCWANQYMGPSI